MTPQTPGGDPPAPLTAAPSVAGSLSDIFFHIDREGAR